MFRHTVALGLAVIMCLTATGCSKSSDVNTSETETTEVNSEETEDEKSVKYNTDDLISGVQSIANYAYNGSIEDSEILKVVKESELDDCRDIIEGSRSSKSDYIDVTSDIQNYSRLKKERDNEIKNNPDKSYAEYKKRMEKLYNDRVGEEVEADDVMEDGDVSDSKENIEEALVQAMMKDIVLPDGTVLWKGMTRRRAEQADDYDKQEFNDALDELYKYYEKANSGEVEQQSYRGTSNNSGGVISLSSTQNSCTNIRVGSSIIRNDAEIDIMSKKEWEEQYTPYSDKIDERIVKDGDTYKVYYSSLTEEDIMSGQVELSVYGFTFRVDVDTDEFGEEVAKGNDDYKFEVSDWKVFDDGHCEMVITSNTNVYNLKFDLDENGKVVNGIGVVQAIITGTDFGVEEE